MSEGPKRRLDKRIVAVLVVAGLLTGAVITYYATASPPASEAESTPRLAPDQRAPYATLHPEEVAEAPAPGAEQADEAAEAETSEADRRAIAAAEHRAAEEGVEDYRELDERLWLEISVKLVIAASSLRHHGNAKQLLLDYTAQLLAEERVEAEEFHAYTKRVAETPARARELSEKILREAEKRTQMEIDVQTIPGLPAAELDIPPEQDQ